MASRSKSIRIIAVLGLASGLMAASEIVPAYSGEKVIHTFQGGGDGASPYGGLVADKAGNLYGTTASGGTGCQAPGCGTIFKLALGGTESVLYAFQGGADGDGPYIGSLLRDKAGNLYGTTFGGGGSGCDGYGCGTVFKLAPDGTETVLYAFQGGTDGQYPFGSLTADKNGNLYGATPQGGNYNGSACSEIGCGTVFEVQPNGTKITLYAFQGGNDGEVPYSGLVMDASGNLYGATESGGSCSFVSYGCGTVFKIGPSGTKTELYAFQGNSDGAFPEAGLIADSAGNLYGTTASGGGANGSCCGTVFRLAADGTETVLHAFQLGSDGSNPEAALIMDKVGNLYGTTYAGGGSRCHVGGCGTVFKLAPDGTESVLFAFEGRRGAPSGDNPVAPVLLKGELLYGTTTVGGTNKDGVVFSVRK